jgi:4-hydroxy-2-oxoheptanedioate aldolase
MASSTTNLFKQRIRNRAEQIGLWLGLADAYVAQLCGNAGFEWVLIDGEHAPNDLRSILLQLQALEAGPAQAVVRALNGGSDTLKQLLDIGARNLLVPMVETAAQAQAVVAATRYPPAGIRGVGSALARASNWGRQSDYLATASADICVIVQIETPAGVEHAREIIATEGVDGVFIGLSDLAATIGHIGNPGHPDVLDAFASVVGKAIQLGKPAGTLVVNEALARHALAMGCSFLAVGSDVGLLVRGAADLLSRYHADRTPSPTVSGIY